MASLRTAYNNLRGPSRGDDSKSKPKLSTYEDKSKAECSAYDAKYKKKFNDQFVSLLRVAAVPTPGLLEFSASGQWSGPIITILRQVVARLPTITRVQIVLAATLADANDLLLSGKVTLVIAPQPITDMFLAQFSALAISDVALSPVFLYSSTGVDLTITSTTVVTCPSGTLSNLLNSKPVDIFNNIIKVITSAPNATTKFLFIVNSAEQRYFLSNVLNITTTTTNVGFIVVDNIISTPDQVAAIIAANTTSTQSACNIAVLADISLTCFSAAALTAASLRITTIPVTELAGTALGWFGPKFAPKLMTSLQLALDQWIYDLKTYEKKHRHYHGTNGGCPVYGVVPAVAATGPVVVSPVVVPVENCHVSRRNHCKKPKHEESSDSCSSSEEEYANDCECDLECYPVVLCVLSPPRPLLSLCRRYIADYTVHELSMTVRDTKCHSVEIIGSDDCDYDNAY